MKVLIVNTSDIQGGAARAAYRLHRSLLTQGVESRMLVLSKSSDDFTVETMHDTKVGKLAGKLGSYMDKVPLMFYKNRTQTHFSPAWVAFGDLEKKIEEIKPDIVHLHWVCGGMMRPEDMARIKVPIVWSLHDMWAFTGGCHYDENCQAYENVCGRCKVLGSEKEKDLSQRVFLRKQKIFSKFEKLTVVGLSRWLHDCAKKSTLLKEKVHVQLPNPIDTDIFKPFDRDMARELLNLPKEKKLVLYGAMGATSDPRKGFTLLSEAMTQIEDQDIAFVVFGSERPKEEPEIGVPTYYLGKLHDDISLVALYSAVDVMVVPSMQENLSNAIMESLSCATPVAAFAIGGNVDMIEHQKNGYTAKPFDTADLAKGIMWILDQDETEYHTLCNNAREKVLKEFDSTVVAQRYVELYQEVLDGQ